MFLPGFKWCEDSSKRPVLAWLLDPTKGYAFVQKGDGSVQVRHTPALLQAGDTVLVAPDNEVLVPDAMLAWARSVMGEEHRMTLAYVSGMVNSGVDPAGFVPDVDPPEPGVPPHRRKGPIALGRGAWDLSS